MKTEDVYSLFMIVAVISFLGFVVENVWMAITKGYIDNRNMIFPFLIGYGIAVVLIYFILGTPKKLWFLGKNLAIKSKVSKIVTYFVGVVICICIGEILLGKFVEKVCHFSWWDYTRLPLHITKYTSIPTSVGFAILITAFMYFCFEPLYYFFRDWNNSVLKVVAPTVMIVMVGDFLYNGYLMYKNKGMVPRWKIGVRKAREML